MATDDRAILRTSALVVGVVALATVLLEALSYALVTFVLFPGVLGPPDSAVGSMLVDSTVVLGALSSRILPLVGVVLGFYLTASRDLPVAPVLAGAFLGGLVAVLGHPLAVGLIIGSPDPSDVALAREGGRWVGRFVVPVLAAVLLGNAIDDLWDRGARWRRARS